MPCFTAPVFFYRLSTTRFSLPSHATYSTNQTQEPNQSQLGHARFPAGTLFPSMSHWVWFIAFSSLKELCHDILSHYFDGLNYG